MQMMFKMFEVENEESLITKISYIFSQFQDFKHFINVINKKKLQCEKLKRLEENC